MTRNISLIVYHRAAYNAHWSLWVEHPMEANIGTIIHAVGDAYNGFRLQFKRGYDLSSTGRNFSQFSLGTVDDDFVIDASLVDEPLIYHEDAPIGPIEQLATTVPCPGKSLRPAGSDPKVRIVHCSLCFHYLIRL